MCLVGASVSERVTITSAGEGHRNQGAVRVLVYVCFTQLPQFSYLHFMLKEAQRSQAYAQLPSLLTTEPRWKFLFQNIVGAEKVFAKYILHIFGSYKNQTGEIKNHTNIYYVKEIKDLFSFFSSYYVKGHFPGNI